MAPTAEPLVYYGMGGIAVAIAACVTIAIGAVMPAWRARAIGIALAWLTVTAALAHFGVLARFDARPPPIMLVIVLAIVGGIALGVSRVGAALATLPLSLIVLFLGFRLPLELIMHEAARTGTMPRVMTFYPGYNHDIVTGGLAIVVAAALRLGAPRAVAWVVAIVGAILLINVIGIALLASPASHAFGATQVNTWVAYFPFVWLPTVLVAAALAGQIVLVRALRYSSEAQSSKRVEPTAKFA